MRPSPARRAGGTDSNILKGADMNSSNRQQPLVGLVGWRGMVGSVLIDRMQAVVAELSSTQNLPIRFEYFMLLLMASLKMR